MQQAEKCPVCKEEWPGDQFVGERAIAAQQGRRPITAAVPRETAPPSSMPNGHHNASQDENGDEDEG